MRNGRRILAMLLSGFLAVSSLHGLVFAEQTGQEPTAYENQEELPVPDTPEQSGDISDEENSEENLQIENEADALIIDKMSGSGEADGYLAICSECLKKIVLEAREEAEAALKERES